jgi:hypothetical protein
MDLEQIFVFPIQAKLTVEKRLAIDAHVDEIGRAFEREVSHKWLKRGEERLVRILVDPITIEAVFFDDRIECFAAAPTWARLLFTKTRKQEVKDRLEQILIEAGFVTAAGA